MTAEKNRGFVPNSIFPNTELTGGEGIGSGKSPCAASVPETFDALENCELLGTLGGKDGKQLLRGAEIWLAGARFALGLAPTVPGASRVARKYDQLFSQGKVRFFPMMWVPAASKSITCVCCALWNKKSIKLQIRNMRHVAQRNQFVTSPVKNHVNIADTFYLQPSAVARGYFFLVKEGGVSRNTS